jgi:hypothetical protein
MMLETSASNNARKAHQDSKELCNCLEGIKYIQGLEDLVWYPGEMLA